MPPMPNDPMMGGGDPMANGGAPDPMAGNEDPMANGDMPNPMSGDEDPMANGGAPDPMAGNEDPMVNEPNMDGEGEGDDDTKKEIQKLAGKLSELLHTYNEENGEDEELNKYVKGMIDAQTDGDSDSDDNNDENQEMGDEENIDNPEDMGNEMEEPKMQERRFSKKQLTEEFAEITKTQRNKEERLNKKVSYDGNIKKTPFIPKKFN